MAFTTRTALVTGASRGLGLALARGLARRGWALVIDAREPAALERARADLERETTVAAIAGDIADADHRAALAAAAMHLGGLDALVNNAGILGPSPLPPLFDYPLAELERVFRVNVVAQLGIIQAARAALKPGARLLTITSDAGIEAYPGWGGYGAAKAALEQLAHVLAAENPDLRVYWVDPGDMRTQMHQEAFPGEDISDRALPEESVPGLLALLEGELPSGRYRALDVTAAGGAHDVTAAGGAHDVATAGGAHDVATAPTEQAPPTSGVRELRVALTVEDFDRQVALYHDGLGLPIVQRWEDANGRGVLLAAGQATLELLDPADAAHTDAIEAGARLSGPVRLAFAVADLDRASGALQAAGARGARRRAHDVGAA